MERASLRILLLALLAGGLAGGLAAGKAAATTYVMVSDAELHGAGRADRRGRGAADHGRRPGRAAGDGLRGRDAAGAEGRGGRARDRRPHDHGTHDPCKSPGRRVAAGDRLPGLGGSGLRTRGARHPLPARGAGRHLPHPPPAAGSVPRGGPRGPPPGGARPLGGERGAPRRLRRARPRPPPDRPAARLRRFRPLGRRRRAGQRRLLSARQGRRARGGDRQVHLLDRRRRGPHPLVRVPGGRNDRLAGGQPRAPGPRRRRLHRARASARGLDQRPRLDRPLRLDRYHGIDRHRLLGACRGRQGGVRGPGRRGRG